MNGRCRRRWRVARVGLALVLLAACSGGRDVPDDYGATTERNFTTGCTTALTSDGEGPTYDLSAAEETCACAYEHITSPDGIPYERFREITDAQESQPTALPPDLRAAVDRCRPTATEAGP